MLEAVLLTIIIGGSVIGCILIGIAVYVLYPRCCRKKGDAAEREALLQKRSGRREKWTYGDLDPSGVQRIHRWMAELVAPPMFENGEEEDQGAAVFSADTLDTRHLGDDMLLVGSAVSTTSSIRGSTNISPRISNMGSTRSMNSSMGGINNGFE